MSALALSQNTVDALHADVERVASGAAAQWVNKAATGPAKKAATSPAICTTTLIVALVKQHEAALAKQEGTITEANAEIERLKHRLSETTRIALKHKNVVRPEVKVEVIEDSDSDTDVIYVYKVVYNGVNYLREVHSNVLYHPGNQEVAGRWNSARGRVDVLPINHHEE